MPWAINGLISTSPIKNGIEITEEEYQAALDGIMNGKIISVESGIFSIIDPPETEPDLPDSEPELTEPNPMPPITARQLRLCLVLNGFSLDLVESAINSIEDETEREVARIEWEYATVFERSHPLIEQIGTSLGLTTEQIDAMWQEAITL